MEEKNENDSGNIFDKRKNAKRLVDKYLRETINSYSEKHAKDELFDALKTIREAEQLIASLHEKIDVLEKEIVILKKKGTDFDYKSNQPHIDKVIFMFRKMERIATIKELTDELIKSDKLLMQTWKDPLKSVSEVVYRAVKDKTIVRYSGRGAHGYYYCLPEWFDESNNLNTKFVS
jgi:hypothetical protein